MLSPQYAEGYDLRLPVAVSSEICTDETRDMISKVCTPMRVAQDGEVVAIVQRARSWEHGMRLDPITQVITATDDNDRLFQRDSFLNLNHKNQEQIALGIVQFQSRPIQSDDLWHTSSPMLDDQEPTEIEVLITPNFAIAAIGNFQRHIQDGSFSREELSQGVLEHAILGILFDDILSSHDIIESLPFPAQMQALANSVWPIDDPYVEDAFILLDPPDLSAI